MFVVDATTAFKVVIQREKSSIKEACREKGEGSVLSFLTYIPICLQFGLILPMEKCPNPQRIFIKVYRSLSQTDDMPGSRISPALGNDSLQFLLCILNEGGKKVRKITRRWENARWDWATG